MSDTYASENPNTDVALSPLHIKTEHFEGPLELLIELVEKRKLLINDISLAAVTSEYMQAVSSMQERSLPHTAQFVALAATLLLIKSKSLLPVLELTTEETERIEDLEITLRYYQIFRDAGLTVQSKFGTTVLAERTPPVVDPLFVPDSYCSVNTLHSSLYALVSELPVTPPKPKVQVAPTVTLEEMIDRLAKRIARDFKVSFSTLQLEERERKTIVVSFLAILELYKQETILIRQTSEFSDIEIEAKYFTTPEYN